MTLAENTSFRELMLREGIEPSEFRNILDTMEAVEMTELIIDLGDQVLGKIRQGSIKSDRGNELLKELLNAVRKPLEARVRVGKIRREVKEQTK